MSNEVLIKQGNKAEWSIDSTPIDPKRLPEGYPYKEGVTIKWDGNTDGLLSMSNMFYKVSDVIPDDEAIKNSILTIIHNGSSKELIVTPEIWNQLVSYGMATESIVVLCGECVIAKVDNAAMENFVFPEAGIYFKKNGSNYTSQLFAGIVHPISSFYLPFETWTFTLEDGNTINRNVVVFE